MFAKLKISVVLLVLAFACTAGDIQHVAVGALVSHPERYVDGRLQIRGYLKYVADGYPIAWLFASIEDAKMSNLANGVPVFHEGRTEMRDAIRDCVEHYVVITGVFGKSSSSLEGATLGLAQVEGILKIDSSKSSLVLLPCTPHTETR